MRFRRIQRKEKGEKPHIQLRNGTDKIKRIKRQAIGQKEDGEKGKKVRPKQSLSKDNIRLKVATATLEHTQHWWGFLCVLHRTDD